MDYLMFFSNIPRTQQYPQQLSVPAADRLAYARLKEILLDIYNWVQDGKNLYLFSNKFGNGKTSWALKLLKNYLNFVVSSTDLVPRGLFISLPDFMLRYKRNYRNPDPMFEYLLDDIEVVDLVVWDDIGFASMSDADFKIISGYIETRYNQKLSNIFTSNLGKKALSAQIGDRLTSRIWNRSEIIELKATDSRTLRKLLNVSDEEEE